MIHADKLVRRFSSVKPISVAGFFRGREGCHYVWFWPSLADEDLLALEPAGSIRGRIGYRIASRRLVALVFIGGSSF